MKILTIIGSPKKRGNSYQAARKLEDEMKKKGDYEFEYIFLKDAHLEACKGCFNCFTRGIELCPLKDDREMIENKMKEAEGLVLVSPVYAITVTALMKNFIDRTAYLCHRPAYHGKKALMLSTTGGIGLKETLNYMEMIAEAWGYKVTGKCGLITAPWPSTTVLEKKYTSSLEKSASQFDKSLKSMNKEKSGEIKVGLKNYMNFKIFKTLTGKVKEYMPADYQYYQDKEYYQPARISIFTKILTEIMLKVVIFLMRDLIPDEKSHDV